MDQHMGMDKYQFMLMIIRFVFDILGSNHEHLTVIVTHGRKNSGNHSQGLCFWSLWECYIVTQTQTLLGPDHVQVFWKHKCFGNISQLENRPLIG